ncbi:MAG: PQQ-binding-like beta-propeller repeat protein [Rhodothermales bacterium]
MHALCRIPVGLFALMLSMSLIAGCSTLKLPPAVTTVEGAPPHTVTFPLSEEWSTDVQAGLATDPFARSGRFVVFGNRQGDVQAVDLDSGRRVGKRGLGHSIEGSPLWLRDILVVPIKHGGAGLQALNLSTGRKLWRYRFEPVEAGLVNVADFVIAAGLRGSVAALEARTGEPVWTIETAGSGFISSPLVLDDSVLLVDRNGTLFSLDALTGRQLWSTNLEVPIHRSIVVSDGRVFVSSTRGRLFSVDAAEGMIAWTYDVEDTNARLTQAAVEESSVVVATSAGIVAGLDARSGNELWMTNLNVAVSAKPIVTPASVVIGGLDGYLYLIDRQTGVIQDRQQMRGRVRAMMAGGDTGLIIATEPHHLTRYVW